MWSLRTLIWLVIVANPALLVLAKTAGPIYVGADQTSPGPVSYAVDGNPITLTNLLQQTGSTAYYMWNETCEQGWVALSSNFKTITASFSFTGTSCTLVVLLTHSGGPFNVYLDGLYFQQGNNYSPSSADNPISGICTSGYIVLDDLQDGQHTVLVQQFNLRSVTVVSGFQYTPSPTSSSGTTAGIIGGIAGGVILLGLLGIIIWQRRRLRRQLEARTGPGVLADPEPIAVKSGPSEDEGLDISRPRRLRPSSSRQNISSMSSTSYHDDIVARSLYAAAPQSRSQPQPPPPPPLDPPIGTRSSVQSQSEILQRLLDRGLSGSALATAIDMLSGSEGRSSVVVRPTSLAGNNDQPPAASSSLLGTRISTTDMAGQPPPPSRLTSPMSEISAPPMYEKIEQDR